MMLGAYLRLCAKKLEQIGISNPHLDVRFLASSVLECSHTDLLAMGDKPLSPEQQIRIEALIDRRAKGEPTFRILGSRDFWGLTFHLNEATLEPRPDSETLIEAALSLPQAPRAILDLGTGSGCLLLALLHEYPDAEGLGVDIAVRAVEQAQMNAERLGLQSRSTFKVSNWLEGLSGMFDLILSNPPYIASHEIATLAAEVRSWDPLRALDGGADGLTPYRDLIPHLPKFLNPGGYVIMEVGTGQAPIVKKVFEENAFSDVRCFQDLAGIERCVCATYIS